MKTARRIAPALLKEQTIPFFTSCCLRLRQSGNNSLRRKKVRADRGEKDEENADAFCLPHRHMDQAGLYIVEHVAGVEDYQLALATFHAACELWPRTHITLRQGARMIEETCGVILHGAAKLRATGKQ